MDNCEKSTNYPSWFALLPRLLKKNKRCYQQVSSATVWRRVEKNAHLGRTFGAGIGPSPKSDESVLAKKTTSIEMFQKWWICC
jgi:hypothetical protein